MTINIPISFLLALKEKNSKYQILWVRWLIYGQNLSSSSILSKIIPQTPNVTTEEIHTIYFWGIEYLRAGGFFNQSENIDFTDLKEKIIELEKRLNILEEKPAKKDKKTTSSEYQDQILEVLEYLNEKTGSKYRISTTKNTEQISARLQEGWNVDNLKEVIDKKVSEWKGTQMEKYLRPITLFNSTKFESYINQKTETGQKNINNIKDAVDKAKELFGISDNR